MSDRGCVANIGDSHDETSCDIPLQCHMMSQTPPRFSSCLLTPSTDNTMSLFVWKITKLRN